MRIIPATPQHADDIARLIMMAMTDDCCRFLAGPGHTLDDFGRTMRRLVLMDDSQYSWRNALMAVDDNADNAEPYAPNNGHTQPAADNARVAGCIVGYDGKDLRRLRRRFQEAALADWQMDYSTMDDETCEGEFYIDSLAVYPEYRRRGVAAMLLRRMAEHAASLGLPAVLLVDKANPNAERLYTALGFEYKNDASWGGHKMKHLVHRLFLRA